MDTFIMWDALPACPPAAWWGRRFACPRAAGALRASEQANRLLHPRVPTPCDTPASRAVALAADYRIKVSVWEEPEWSRVRNAKARSISMKKTWTKGTP